MKEKWQRYPFFLLLLPVFFVFHGYVENYHFIPFGDCLIILGMYLAGAVVLYGITWWILKDSTKAALLTSFMLAIYFFFGAVHDFFRRNNIFLHKYSLLLPLLAIAIALLAFYLKKKKSPFVRLPSFLNWLFLSFIAWDAGTLLWTSSRTRTGPSLDQSALSATRCDSCARPDIYFILSDDYTNSRTLKELYHYDNSALDSFLVKEGFHIQWNSRSNYASTPVSMASILNYSYLKGLDSVTFQSYLDMWDLIAKSAAINFLYKEGYSVVNYSFFDLPESPTGKEIPFIPLKGRLITNRTLLNYLVRDVLNPIKHKLIDSVTLTNDVHNLTDRENERVLQQTMEESRRKRDQPRFVYTHLFMPHPPYLYDSLRKHRSMHEIALLAGSEQFPKYYLEYLPYTNDRIRQLISTIKTNTHGQAVILFMSDHGYRCSVNGKATPYFFHNQNAMYFPDKDYRLLYDSMSAVNEFRVVFNKFFKQQLPLLKDSTIYLTEK